MSKPAAEERALEDDVLRVSAELQQPGEGGESPMLDAVVVVVTKVCELFTFFVYHL